MTLRLLPFVLLPGCGLIAGLRTDYELGDASIGMDGSFIDVDRPDVVSTDGGPDGGTVVEGGITYDCNGGPVPSCASCPNMGLTCTYCESDGGAALAGRCIAYAQNALCPTPPPGFQLCSCGGPSTCAASTQVCFTGNVCRTCGEKMTDGWGCKNGGVCAFKDGGCF